MAQEQLGQTLRDQARYDGAFSELQQERAREQYAAAPAILTQLGERLYAERIEHALAGISHQ